MLVNALYNIVDSFYVARISEEALTAVSLIFPLQNLVSALAIGFGIGINVVISISLGAGKKEKADQAFTKGVVLSELHGLICTVLCLICMSPFISCFTDQSLIHAYAMEYGMVVFAFSVFFHLAMAFEKIFQAVGRMKTSMVALLAGCVFNIILDPIMIFGLFGFPRLEAKGAAVATVIGQCIAGILAIIFNLKYNDDLDFNFKRFRPCGYVIKNIYIIGVPSIIMQSIGSVMVLGLNKILMAFSSTAVAVFGVYFKLQSFVFMPVFGLNNGMIPIIAYNYGAKKKDRMIKTYHFALQIAVTIMVVGAIVMELIPGVILNIFNASDSMLAMGITALKIISIHFPIAAFCIVTGSLFQALGKATYSMINSIMRQLVVLLPVAYLLGLTGNVNNVWWAFPIAELASATVTSLFYIKVKKTIISKI